MHSLLCAGQCSRGREWSREQNRSSPCPLEFICCWQSEEGAGGGGGGVKYKVCRMAISTMEKNKAGKGFAIVNRVE